MMVAHGGSFEATAVRAENLDQALGIGTARPRISWQVVTDTRNWHQSAYEIEITDPGSAERIAKRVSSSQSLYVPWPATALKSRDRRELRVRVWGQDAPPSPWSMPVVVEAGLLEPADWIARFITPDWQHDDAMPLMRGEFLVSREVSLARLYATALGVFELEMNGQRIGDHALSPGWTSYSHRLRYVTFDITGLLQTGTNAVGAWLADGWYRGRLGFGGGYRNIYGEDLALLVQVEVTYADGVREHFGTGPAWRALPGPVQSASLYDGERYDARRGMPGWSLPEYDASGWPGTKPVARDFATLVAPVGPPVRCTQEIAPVAILTSPRGKTILDFGQNLVGRLRVRLVGAAGTTVRIRHSEILEDGEICTRPLREAAATDEYTLSGQEEWQEWEPRFTFHGFRYAEITGSHGGIPASGDVVARVYHTDMRKIGGFISSDELLNRLHANIEWSMRGNFLDIPTDCPQRDERLGWTGDIQIFAPTATYLYDCAGILASWLRDLAADQLSDGTVPFFIPTIPAVRWTPPYPAAAWGDAAVLTPWVLYQRFGDAGVLRDQFSSARAWVDRVSACAGENRVWDSGLQIGDWLDPSAPPGEPGAAKCDPHLLATAYFARSSAVLSQMAGVLGYSSHADYYGGLAAEVKSAFVRRWVLPTGLLSDDAQTSHALAICFRLLENPRQYQAAGRRLAELVRESGHRIATGFVGTPLICDALTESGYLDDAYSMLFQQDCPSWLYPVLNGATTVWERWDSLRPDGSINPGQMTSFNHYALGAVGDWLHRTVGGLAPAEPGYRRLLIRPRPGGQLRHAATYHDTPYGRAEVSWWLKGSILTLDIAVPPGVTATVDLAGQAPVTVGSGRHSWRVGAG